MKRLALILLLVVCTTAMTMAQNDLIVSQYIHNRFAINPAFAGSREGLTLFGSFRKQWTGIEKTPMSELFTMHMPLKKENIVLGLSVYNQNIHQSMNAGVMATVGYRTRMGERTWLSFALQPGASMRSTNWAKVNTIEPDDNVFLENESSISPLLGFGVSIYNRDLFVGASVSSFMVSDDFDQRDAKFDPANATYIATAGYMFRLGEEFKLQPSVMASYNKKNEVTADATLTAIFNDFIWADIAYRTTDEAIAGLAVQAIPQLRIAYSYEFNFGDLNGYSTGSHEISIQYDLVYKVKTVGPRFF